MRGPLALLILALLCHVAQAQEISNPGVLGPASAVSGHVATFSGTSGKIIQDGGAAGSGTVTSVTCGTGLSGGVITGTGTCALIQQNSPYWRLYRNTTSQSISSSPSTIVFNAATSNVGSNCSTATGICTITSAGAYQLYCQAQGDMNIAATVNANLIGVRLQVNGSNVAIGNVLSQAATGTTSTNNIASVATLAQLNVSDTVSCTAVSDGTVPIVAFGQTASFMTGFRTGAQ